MPQADLGQRIDEALPGDFLDETAECHVGHADHGRDFGEGDLPVEILVHIGENRLQAC